MRRPLAITLAVVVTASSATALGSDTAPGCSTALPHGPRVPAAIVFTSSCGMFRLDEGGRVSKLPRRWLASHGGGSGRRWGADLKLRRNRAGSFFLLRGHQLVWRSRGRFPNDGGSVAFGPGLFAFATYRGGIYLTDLRSPERLVVRGRGTYPLDFTAAGRLLAVDGHTIDLVSRDGAIARALAFDPRRGLALDPRSDTLYFVTARDVLATLEGTRVHRLASVARLGGAFALAEPGLMTWAGGHSLAVTTRDVSIVASARWPKKLGAPDLGVSTSGDGTLFAFRLSNAFPGKHDASSRVFVLRRGGHEMREIARHRYAQAGCGVLGSLGWHAHELLYDGGLGKALIFAADGSAKPLTLERFTRRLPHEGRNDLPSAAWASDYRR